MTFIMAEVRLFQRERTSAKLLKKDEHVLFNGYVALVEDVQPANNGDIEISTCALFRDQVIRQKTTVPSNFKIAVIDVYQTADKIAFTTPKEPVPSDDQA